MKTRNHSKTAAVLLLNLIIILLLSIPLSAEFIFLKTGEILEGSIISDSAKTLVLKTKENKTVNVSRDSIMRILYTKLKMGKIFIQKRDGEGIVAFIVDEDQETYTFRKELYQPEEFTLNRGDVLFMAEKNPSGLKVDGETGTDSVSLVWLPPYDVVKKYNVYIKEDKAAQYKITDTAKGKSVTLKNLLSNRTYYLTVTSVDGDGYESSPSNELVIKTKNVPPYPVKNISLIKNSDGSGLLSWDKTSDPDGTVQKYRIYGETGNEKNLLNETASLTSTVKNYQGIDIIYVTAVDEMNGESEDSLLFLINNGLVLSINPGMIFPVGKFADIAGPGYGASVSVMYMGLFKMPLEAGVESGFYNLSGRDNLESDNLKTERAYFVLMYFYCGYRFEPSERFFVTPYINAGAAYMNMPYTKRDWETLEESSKTMTDFGPAGAIGVSFSYRLNNAYFANMRASYGYLMGADGGFFTTLDLGLMCRI
jgi:hypothetical protein